MVAGNDNVIITIDGPAGCGKSTVAKIVADKVKYFYLDSGAMYRIVALAVKERNMEVDDNDDVPESFLNGLDIGIRKDEKNGFRYTLNKNDVTGRIRDHDITMLSANIARLKNVRSYLAEQQRKIGLKMNLVAEGRDMGTCVFSDAKYKFFLTGTAEERAKRRFKELVENEVGGKISYGEVLESIVNRDKQDRERKESPLRPSENAVIIDTTDLTLKEVVNRIMKTLEGTST